MRADDAPTRGRARTGDGKEHGQRDRRKHHRPAHDHHVSRSTAATRCAVPPATRFANVLIATRIDDQAGREPGAAPVTSTMMTPTTANATNPSPTACTGSYGTAPSAKPVAAATTMTVNVEIAPRRARRKSSTANARKKRLAMPVVAEGSDPARRRGCGPHPHPVDRVAVRDQAPQKRRHASPAPSSARMTTTIETTSPMRTKFCGAKSIT